MNHKHCLELQDPRFKERDGEVLVFPPFPLIFFLSWFIAICKLIKRGVFKESGIAMLVSTTFSHENNKKKYYANFDFRNCEV